MQCAFKDRRSKVEDYSKDGKLAMIIKAGQIFYRENQQSPFNMFKHSRVNSFNSLGQKHENLLIQRIFDKTGKGIGKRKLF